MDKIENIDQIANDLFRYFETLFYINKKIFILMGYSIYFEKIDHEQLLLSSISELLRIIPIERYNHGKNIHITNDNIRRFSKEFPFIDTTIHDLIASDEKTLINMCLLRNKYQHEVHVITHDAFGSFDGYEIDFVVKSNRINFTLKSLINVIKKINIMYSMINQYIINHYKYNLEYHPFYQRITKINFSKLNAIYDISQKHASQISALFFEY